MAIYINADKNDHFMGFFVFFKENDCQLSVGYYFRLT